LLRICDQPVGPDGGDESQRGGQEGGIQQVQRNEEPQEGAKDEWQEQGDEDGSHAVEVGVLGEHVEEAQGDQVLEDGGGHR